MQYLKYYSYTIAIILGIFIFGSYHDKSEVPVTDAPVINDLERLPQVITSIPLKDKYDFAGEHVPIENFDVKERLERELLVNSYWHSSTVLNIKNASRFFPMFEQILFEHDIPDDFKYISVIESNLRNETSPAGAKGFWQFMSSVGKFYGLEINSEVDERFHLEKATVAACKYIKDSKRRFGSWTAAAAAYNMGDTRFKKEQELQKTSSYYDMNLNAETARYLFRILAVKEIISEPATFGFKLDPSELYYPLNDYYELEVKTSIPNIGSFAEEHGTTYRMVKLLNPWLRTSKLTNKSGKAYKIKLPKN